MEIGLAKTIGVANCSKVQLQRILNAATISPTIVHIECCPGFHQKKLIKYCKDENIPVTAYCPLNRPDFREFAEHYNHHSGVLEICQKYNKTSSQLILRYLVILLRPSAAYCIVALHFEPFYLFAVSIGNDTDSKVDNTEPNGSIHRYLWL